MRNIWHITRRELGAIFTQPIAYIFAIAIVGITGYIYSGQIAAMVIQPGSVPVSVGPALQLYGFLFIFVAPAVTMRLISEEQRSGTMELLMTLPIRDTEVVVGKWLAGFIFFLATTALTLVYPLVLIGFGNPDIGVLLSGYVGILLSGAALIAIGILASSLTESQIVAFFIAFLIILLLYVISFAATGFQLNETFSNILIELSFNDHLGNFYRGLIFATDVIYFIGLASVSLFASARVLESRRWR